MARPRLSDSTINNGKHKWASWKRHVREHGSPGKGMVWHHVDGGKGYKPTRQGLQRLSRSAHLALHNRKR